MSGIGIVPAWILIFGGAAALLIICLVQLGRRRRGGRLFVTCMILLMVLGAFALLLPVSMQRQAAALQSRAAAERAQAMAMQLEASRQAAISVPRSPQLPNAPRLPDQPGEEADAQDDAAAFDDEAASRLESGMEIESTSGEIDSETSIVVQGSNGVRVETISPQKRGRAKHSTQTYYGSRTHTRSSGSQFISSILLAALIFSGYFFLNANTRGHYTWQLRLGSTLVFVASLAVVFFVGRHF